MKKAENTKAERAAAIALERGSGLMQRQTNQEKWATFYTSPEHASEDRKPLPALIIGSGPAGLATAACLHQQKIPYQMVDRYGQVGGAYSRLYPNNLMISPNSFLEMPHFSIAQSGLDIQGEYMTLGQFQQYMEAYAAHFGIKPEVQIVSKVQPHAEGYRVQYKSGAVRMYQTVVIATGCYDSPWLPTIRGLDSEHPAIDHAADWQGPKRLKDKQVLVVGAGISGTEIAEECARAGVAVSLSSRRPNPKFINPKPLGIALLNFSVPFEHLPRWFYPKICSGKSFNRGYDQGISKFIKAGKVDLKPGIASLTGTSVNFADGSQADYDYIVFATGYRFEMPFLPEDTLGKFDLPNTKRNGACQTHPGLFFIGTRCSSGIDSHYVRGMARQAPMLTKQLKKFVTL